MPKRLFHYGGQISIHALREESDLNLAHILNYKLLFQSTLSARRATATAAIQAAKTENFNPRSPRGERRGAKQILPAPTHFNPRSPRGERQYRGSSSHRADNFNPRSPRGERPKIPIWNNHSSDYFNPRSPRGERPPFPMRVKIY